MNLDIRHLQQIEILARHRNFARAAGELNISQPGLSQSIRVIEEQMGQKLFDRHTRQVTPTAFGKRILELSESILRDYEFMDRELQMLGDLKKGLVRIGIGPLAAEVFLDRTLGRLGADYPGFTIRTKVEWVPDLLEGLNTGDLDILVCDTRFMNHREEYNIIDLPRYHACFVCRQDHPLSRKKRVSFSDIFEYQIATPKLPQPIINKFASLSGYTFTSMNEFPNGLVEAPYHLLARTISHCDAVGIGIMPIFQQGIKSGTLHLLPLHDKNLTTQYELVNLKRYTMSPAVQIFQQYVITACQELAEEHRK
ncbi:MAG: LysR family transcriptional regulator [Thermodesulfobacteriota bacterium]|nr:LysR family transcriptional regulator [Thermodesulfobacteriota bacterium]